MYHGVQQRPTTPHSTSYCSVQQQPTSNINGQMHCGVGQEQPFFFKVMMSCTMRSFVMIDPWVTILGHYL